MSSERNALRKGNFECLVECEYLMNTLFAELVPPFQSRTSARTVFPSLRFAEGLEEDQKH